MSLAIMEGSLWPVSAWPVLAPLVPHAESGNSIAGG